MIKSTIIKGEELERIKIHAENAWINGKSNIRSKDREKEGMTDQLVGQLGEYSIAKFFKNPEAYFRRREELDKTPWKGDNGSDFGDLKIDVKASLMRRSKDIFTYNLLVRPKEYHENTFYVLCLIDELDEGYKVYLVGYATTDMFPPIEQSGPFKGAHKLKATKLLEITALARLVEETILIR